MTDLSKLKDTSRSPKRRKRVGRGPGSGMGKTSGRGHKGAASRSGYKRREGYEGGRLRLFQSLPTRGFSRARFQKRLHAVNLWQIERDFDEGAEVKLPGCKLLGKGELNKKVASIEVDAVSASAREKLEKAGIAIKVKQ